MTRLAHASFGEGGVFVERFVGGPPRRGAAVRGPVRRVVALGERDCSAQRRHQKVIEEAPPRTARRAAHDDCGPSAAPGRSVGYRSAGTVEFVVDVAVGATERSSKSTPGSRWSTA